MTHAPQHAESLFAGLLDQWASSQSMSPAQMEAAVRALQAQHPAHAQALESIWHEYAAVDQALQSELRSMVAERARLDAQHQALLADLETTTPFAQRYQREGELGRGGMGVVERVYDQRLKRALAMKLVLRGGNEQQRLARFLNEARITSQLDHPGIVPVHDVGVDPQGRAYFTMKLVSGVTLQTVYQRLEEGDGEWSQSRVLRIVERVCEALAFAHERGVIHRDVKPHNIMVGAFGEVHVMDWGLARRLADPDAGEASARALAQVVDRQVDLTLEGAAVGTPAYMSPEQAQGDLARMGPQADVYAVGALLYHLLAGTPPYIARGEKTQSEVVLARVLAGPPEPIRTRTAPPELVAICERAMARAPEQRYANMAALADELERFLAGRTVRAFDTGTWAETKKWVQRNRALSGALFASLTILVAGIVLTMRESRRAHAAELDSQAQTVLAQQRTEDVLSLSAQKELEDLSAEADQLWPVSSALSSKMDAWLARSRTLLEGSPSSAQLRPGLAGHRAQLAKLRERALPRTPEQVEADFQSWPRYAEWKRAETQCVWMRRMLGEEPWPAMPTAETVLQQPDLPTDGVSVAVLCMKYIDPNTGTRVYGEEPKGLVLAQHAVSIATPEERVRLLSVLMWAYFANGRFEDASRTADSIMDGEMDAAERRRRGLIIKPLERELARWTEDSQRAKRREEVQAVGVEVDKGRVEGQAYRTWRYADAGDQWWDHMLTRLIAQLEAFADEGTGGLASRGVHATRGWGVQRRADVAREVYAQTISSDAAQARWRTALQEIAAAPRYAQTRWKGGQLVAQEGLLPLGLDPASGLYEFLLVASGTAPVRNADGAYQLEEATGIVLVLLPGGTTTQGAQATDSRAAGYDSLAESDEAPVRVVHLSPYFLGKYEVTQAQWKRLAGVNPAAIREDTSKLLVSTLHPVEHITWNEARELLVRFGLDLPTEARWEAAARAGTLTPWSSGATPESVYGYANLAERSLRKLSPAAATLESVTDHDDRQAVHAPCGSFRPNAYGLHDMHGNVAEWALDAYAPIPEGPLRDPVMPWKDTPNRVLRGGNFYSIPAKMRSSYRFGALMNERQDSYGVRVARDVQ